MATEVKTDAPAAAAAAPAAPAAAAAPAAPAPTPATDAAAVPAAAPAAAPAPAPAATVVTDPAKPAGGDPAKPAAEPTAEEKAATEKAAAEARKTAAREAAIKEGVLEVAPEKYEDFAMPKGMVLDAKVLAEFAPIAKELGMTQASAQKLVDLYANKVMPRIGEVLAESLTAQSAAWEKATREDKTLGGEKFAENMEVAKATLRKFGSEGLTKLLNDSRLGNHPEMVRFFHNVGKAMQEDNIGGFGGGGAEPKDAAKVMYPDMK